MVVGVSILAIVSTHVHFGLDVRKTGYNLALALVLLVVAVYRVASCFSTDPDSPARSLAAFWVLMILFELYVAHCPLRDSHRPRPGSPLTNENSIAYIMLLSISLPAWYPAVQAQKEGEGEKRFDVEQAQARAQAQAPPRY